MKLFSQAVQSWRHRLAVPLGLLGYWFGMPAAFVFSITVPWTLHMESTWNRLMVAGVLGAALFLLDSIAQASQTPAEGAA